MADRRQMQLGLFVIGSTLLLGMLALFFGGTPQLFTRRAYYTIVFDEAQGVVKGTPVRKSGVKIGEVVAVSLDDEKHVVRVQIAIDPSYSLRTSEEPVIVTDLLSRDSTIDFVPLVPPKVKPGEPKPQSRSPIVPAGYAQAEPAQKPEPPPDRVIPPGAEIRGKAPLDTRQLIRDASDVLPSAQLSLNQIRKSVERFEKVAPILEETLREFTELARASRAAIPEVRQTNDKVRETVTRLAKLEPDVRKLLEDLQEAAKTYRRLGDKVETTVDANRAEIDRSVKNFAEVLQRLASVLNEENQKNLAATLKSTQSLSKSLEETSNRARTQTLPQLENAIVNLNNTLKPFSDRSDRIAQNLDYTIDRVARAIGGLTDALGKAGSGDGTLQRFLNDPSVFNNLNDASLMLTRILPRVDRILKDLEVFADKVARHPESLGVGGAVRPSAGLKEGAPR